jgi:hypothetical protein
MPFHAERQRGAALLALLAVIMLGASWFLVSKLSAESGGVEAARRARNAEVLNRAKLALVGYVAMQAANSGEDNPGALPCPEAAGYFDNPGQQGQAASSCTLPKVGRFPWRTIGTEKLVDSAGEPLWYVVSPGWAYTSGNTKINSDTLGQLTVDGTANAAVALIIAPGPAFSVPACGAIPAKVQVRPIADPLDGNPFPDLRNYLECENATAPTPDITFVTSGPSGSFNDQVVRVTVADIMPGIEAAIAKRIERDIVPSLKTVFASTQWGSGISSTTPMFPYAAPWSTSQFGPGPGTTISPSSDYKGAAGTYQGLLPFNQTVGCTTNAADPRCITTLIMFSKSGNDAKTAGSGSIHTQSTCSWQSTVYVCTGQYDQPSISLTFKLKITDVAMGLRTLDLTKVTCTAVDDVGNGLPTQNVACTPTVAIQNDGSAIVTVATSALPDIAGSGWGTFANYMINFDRALIGDHALLSSTATTTGWFVRNEWYRLLYYATSRELTAEKLTFSCPITGCCTTGNNCLTVTNMVPADNKRALLILAGRSTKGAARPNGTLADYLEFGNADLNTTFEKQPISRASNAAAKQPFNDRVIVLDSN